MTSIMSSRYDREEIDEYYRKMSYLSIHPYIHVFTYRQLSPTYTGPGEGRFLRQANAHPYLEHSFSLK